MTESLSKQLHNWRAANKDFSGGSCPIDDNKNFTYEMTYGDFTMCGEDLDLTMDEAIRLHKALTEHLRKWDRL